MRKHKRHGGCPSQPGRRSERDLHIMALLITKAAWLFTRFKDHGGHHRCCPKDVADEELISGRVLLTLAVCNPCELLGSVARSWSSSCHFTMCSKMTACSNVLFRRYKNQLQPRRGRRCLLWRFHVVSTFGFSFSLCCIWSDAISSSSGFPHLVVGHPTLRPMLFFRASQKKTFRVSNCGYMATLNHKLYFLYPWKCAKPKYGNKRN